MVGDEMRYQEIPETLDNIALTQEIWGLNASRRKARAGGQDQERVGSRRWISCSRRSKKTGLRKNRL